MEKKNQYQLLRERRFFPFFLTQFFGAFNDNVYKNALVILVAYHAAEYSSLDPNLLTNAAAGIFIFPFLLFSASAGQVADKFDKAVIIRIIKSVEIGIMLIGSAGLLLHSLPLLFTGLFMLGLHSAFSAPQSTQSCPRRLSPLNCSAATASLKWVRLSRYLLEHSSPACWSPRKEALAGCAP